VEHRSVFQVSNVRWGPYKTTQEMKTVENEAL